MEWTDIQITVPQQYAETAEAIATMVSNGGIYIEDYRDLEQQAWEIAHVDLIEQDLLDQPRDIVKVHMYLAPDENPAEILPLFKERLEASGVEDKLETSGGGSSVQPSGGASYQVVNLSAGQTITGGAACEFLLRSGTATCVSDTSPGLVDMTAGTTLAGGGALTANHLYLATIEGRGVKASTAVTLLVRGTYSIQ